ncbi:hypothetical protein LZ554_000168 [Drepanopeziza brunnea f. sp. 'monogermtubi']|nr:hypothetical protein LZ554_000168 [Drepanopeziza brunnea f. sp. 'monogermtubi']
MDVMELVENEQNARPFQCDWQTCSKSFNRKSDLQRHYRIHTNERPYSCMTQGCGKSFIQRSALTVHVRTHTGEKPHQCQHIGCGKRFSDSSSLARHRRIHTGKRPYKCAHEGCLKSFCRKTTMVKHQRRSHQRGIHSSELDDGDTSDSDSGESPSTPQHPGSMQWHQSLHVPAPLLHGQQMHRAHSFTNFGHPQHQVDAYSMPQQFMADRHNLSGLAPPQQQYHGHLPEQAMPRAPSLPAHSSYYVPEQNNPGVATLNTNPVPMQNYQLPRQVDRQEGLQASPSSYSSASRASPEQFFSHHPPPQGPPGTTYTHPSPPLVEQQPMMHYQHQMTPQHLSQNHGLPPLPQGPEPYHQPPHTPASEEQWYHNTAAYQPPIEVVGHPSGGYPQVSHIIAYQDPWKVESFDDPAMQMPSARIENL